MNVVMWAPVVNAGVAVLSAAAASVMWMRARAERQEAARQAKSASDAAVESARSLTAIAEIQRQRHEAAAVQQADEEVEPWVVEDMADSSVEMRLRNTTARSKYGVRVVGPTVDSDDIGFIGPHARKRISAFRIGNGPGARRHQLAPRPRMRRPRALAAV